MGGFRGFRKIQKMGITQLMGWNEMQEGRFELPKTTKVPAH